MSTRGALKQLKNVWGKAGLDAVPTPDETTGILEPGRRRKKSDRTAQLNLRIRPEEKQSIELLAVRERAAINEIFSRMLALYEREHGRAELSASKDKEQKR